MILLCSDDPTTSYTAAWPLSSRGDYLTHLLVTNIVPLLPWISRVRRCMFCFSGSCHGRAGSRVTRWILFFTWIRPWFLPIIQFKAPFNLYSVDINDLVTVALADLVNQVVVFFLQIVYVRAATLDVPKQAVRSFYVFCGESSAWSQALDSNLQATQTSASFQRTSAVISACQS